MLVKFDHAQSVRELDISHGMWSLHGSRSSWIDRCVDARRPAPRIAKLASINKWNEFLDTRFVCCVAGELFFEPTFFASCLDVEKRQQQERGDKSSNAVPNQTPAEGGQAEAAVNRMAHD